MNFGIGNVKGKTGAISNNGAYFVDLTNATESSGTYTIPSEDIENGDFTLQVGDMLIDKNSGNLLKVATLTPDITADLVVEASSGGGGAGTPLYLHNVKMHTSSLQITLTIINASNTALDKDSINSWLSDNGYTGASPNYETYNLGFVYSSNNDKLASQGVAYRSGTTFSYKNIVGSWVGINNADITFEYDKIQELGTASINGGGSQLYRNSVYINNLKWTSEDTRYFIGVIDIICDTQFTSANDFINWYKGLSSNFVVDGIGTGYGSGYITHIRKLYPPRYVEYVGTIAKFDMIHTTNGSPIFTNAQESNTALESQDIRVESQAL